MITNVDFQKTIEDAFLLYGASVAQERAIPDVRDGLKIGLRQGLYAQFTNKLTHKDKFQKAQKSVAAAMSQSYVHGDVAMYDTLIRAAKPWIYRYPIEDVQGAYGDPCAPDNHSASRYVEMKAGLLADYFFSGLKRNAIEEWYPNYDDTEMIPSVFPSIGFWNIVNGCSGIAVAMTTSVPQFNIKEVNNALIKLINNPDEDFDNIYCAPDFAQGATIINGAEVKESLRTGEGASIRLRATLQYHPDQNMIQATEMPFGVFTNTIIKQLQELTDNDENYGISRVVDHTKRKADIHIYLNKGVNAKRMITKLYKDTSLENFFAINMTMLEQGRFPKVFGWREACNAYIAHIRNSKYREIEYDYNKAVARENIVNGLLIAAANIDDIVVIIRGSDSPAQAGEKLKARYDFNDEQIKAILAMKLSSLTRIDGIQLEKEKEELARTIAEFKSILDDPKKLDAELINILTDVAKKFGDERRTKVLNLSEPNEIEQPEIKEEEVVAFLFSNNMVRVQPKNEINGAKRGAKGKKMPVPSGATIVNTLYCTNLSSLACFTSAGKMYSFSISDIPYNQDISLYELIQINDEQAMVMINKSDLRDYKYLVTVSKNGYLKKSKISEYLGHAKKGLISVKLVDGDTLVGVYLSANENDKIFVASNNGNYNYYGLDTINPTGRATLGVKAIALTKGAWIASSALVKDSIEYIGLLTISTSGRGKITALTDYSETSRAIKGNAVMKFDKDEELAAISLIPHDKDTVIVIAGNKVNSLKMSDIPVQSRVSLGVNIIDARGTKNKIAII